MFYWKSWSTSTTATISANRKSAGRPADLVILMALDHIYAPAIRQLRLLGVPTWVLQPGRFIAADLYKAAAAVTRLAPPRWRREPDTTPGSLAPQGGYRDGHSIGA